MAPMGSLGQILAREFSYITPANDFKQSHIHPEPGIWRWEYPDAWVAFAEKHNQVIRIHGPISPQCSKWAMADDRTAEELEQNLKEYMTALYSRKDTHKFSCVKTWVSSLMRSLMIRLIRRFSCPEKKLVGTQVNRFVINHLQVIVIRIGKQVRFRLNHESCLLD